ncbi:penicillin-binding protein 2 [Prosthecobacter fusiformis]|uniref:Penicillin-binding protein 2 n=1 Tax=Prosthecobacter fusiformis TaxID=48464 RepID=A0A4R7RS77_9BACT|nr:penicillin-binding protein 2 [Prosthecobacter fusiformis]TDU67167.1 penicillin-binding protein 2 [Prosthecobacter fusiformis]
MVVKYRFRLYLLTLAMMCGFGVLVYRLWTLQIVRHEEFVNKVPEAKQLRARIPGVRGEIKDRNGIVLATNKASFEVRVNLREVYEEYARQCQAKKVDIPTVPFEYMDRGLPRKKEEPDIVRMFQELIIARLKEMGLPAPSFDEALRVHYRSFGGVIPWVYQDSLTFSEFSRFAEHNLGLPGVTVAERGSRVYPFGAMACHIMGYVRLPDDQRVSVEDRKGWDYYMPDDYGGAGVEKSFDKYMRGKPGVRTMQVNERGRIVGEVSFEEPRKGNDVYLTLDARIQYIAEKALRDGNIGRGSVVVIQPQTGEVLAMASVPSYDPNRFIPSISQADYNVLLSNRTVPLMNRATRTFVPGSTYKVPIALAGCLAGIQSRNFNCSGSVTYGSKAMQCWIQRQGGGSHGSLGLSDALMRSCNCFFYQYGNSAGIDNITKAGKLLGLGERTGIELEEDDGGILPNPAWLRMASPKDRWSNGHTANTSIGQGSVLASPLQMASVTGAVAAGKSYVPHLLHRVMDNDELVMENKPVLRSDLSQHFDAKSLEMVRKGMWKVVNDAGGTAKGARIPGVEVAGKTGTAQNWRRDERNVRVVDNHTLFISFAPYVNPKYAICILVQGGKSGGGCAAPVAHRVLEQALALENGYQVTPETLGEVEGNFKPIEAVTYADLGVPVVAAADEDGDTGTNEPANESTDEAPRTSAAPSIRREADREASAGAGSSKPARKAEPVRRAPLFKRGGSSDESNPSNPGGGFFRRIFRQ